MASLPYKSEAGEVQVIEDMEQAHEIGKHHIPLDLDDPHRAALEDNPEHADKLTWTTLLAVIVSLHVL
jgi:hypothetical protein